MAASINRPFVRTADYFLLSGPALDAPDTIKRLAAFDVIVIPSEAQAYNRSFFAAIRRLNPAIKILAYVPTVSWNDAYWNDPIHAALKAGIQPGWWLTDAAGNQKSLWPNTRALNLHSGWVPYLANHVTHDLLGSGLWDGVMYDEVQDSISWIGSVDTNRDGRNDTVAEANARWAAGFTDLLRQTRAAAGNDPIILTNGSSNPAFAAYVNGRMFESFPTMSAGWTNALRDYLREQSLLGLSNVDIINANTGNAGDKNDYRAMRFGLGSALLGDGFYSFDFGTQNHSQLWRYDEENAYLGQPKGDPIKGAGDVWTRAFSNGEVVVNAGTGARTLTLDGEYERLHGTQDTAVNNGAISSRVTIAPQDSLLLLRPIDQLIGAAFPNGAFARIFDNHARVKRTGFFAYDVSARGGDRVFFVPQVPLPRVVADETSVTVSGHGRAIVRFAPYGAAYRGGISLAVADVDGDGQPEIIVAPGPGIAPLVRVYRMDGTLVSSFLAFDKGFRGGVSVAAGDTTGDGKPEIIVGAGKGGAPQVRVFALQPTTYNLQPSFLPSGQPFNAFPAGFRGGVHVAAGDVDGDGRADIVVGAGAGGGPQVRIFKPNGTLEGQFFAGDPKSRGGTDVAVSDVDGDGRAEIIGLSTSVFTLNGM